MGKLFGTSDYGDAEGRIRRLLSLEGLVPIEVSTDLLPVMIVGDGLGTGYNASRNRAWRQCWDALSPTGTSLWLKTSAPKLIIDEVEAYSVGGAATDTLKMYLYPPGTPSPVNPVGGTATVIEDSRGDRVPLDNQLVAGAPTVPPFLAPAIRGAPQWWFSTLRLTLIPGSVLQIRYTSAVGGGFNVNVAGRTW